MRVVTTEPVGDNALTVYYKTSDGRLLERMLFRTDEATWRSPRLDGRGLRCAGAAFNWRPRPTALRWPICSTP